MKNPKHACVWVIQPAAFGVAATYCGRPTHYWMVTDDSGARVRRYDSFCPEHASRARAERREMTDDET